MNENERPRIGEPCGNCGVIIESMTAEPFKGIVASRGWPEYAAVEVTVRPCGDVYRDRIKTSDDKASDDGRPSGVAEARSLEREEEG